MEKEWAESIAYNKAAQAFSLPADHGSPASSIDEGAVTNEIVDLISGRGNNGTGLEFLSGTGEVNSFIVKKGGREFRVTVTTEFE